MSDLLYWCPSCASIACEVIGRDVSARLELDRMREGHKAWHRDIAKVAQGIDA